MDPYDRDSDGLIEVSNVAQLSVIRCDLDGNGVVDDGTVPSAGNARNNRADAYVRAFGQTALPAHAAYIGYELANNLSFAGTVWGACGVTGSDPMAEGWEPIENAAVRYTAVFEGSFTIDGLYINRPSTDYIGLFGYVDDGAFIHRVCLEDVYVHGRDDVGGLVGYSAGTITSSYVTGTVMGDDRVGGLAGFSAGTITSSCSTGMVMGDDRVGGLVGGSSGTITSNYSTGDVSGDDAVGGLVGGSSGTITSSYSTGIGDGR